MIINAAGLLGPQGSAFPDEPAPARSLLLAACCSQLVRKIILDLPDAINISKKEKQRLAKTVSQYGGLYYALLL